MLSTNSISLSRYILIKPPISHSSSGKDAERKSLEKRTLLNMFASYFRKRFLKRKLGSISSFSLGKVYATTETKNETLLFGCPNCCNILNFKSDRRQNIWTRKCKDWLKLYKLPLLSHSVKNFSSGKFCESVLYALNSSSDFVFSFPNFNLIEKCPWI